MLERNKLRDSENSQSNQSKSKLKRLMSLDVSSNMSNKIAGLINKKKDILGTHAEQDAKAHFPMF